MLVAGLSTVDLGLLDVAVRSASRTALAQESISLRIRRGGRGVEVVVDGVGAQPLLEQRLNGPVWEGRLQTKGTPGVGSGLQQLSDPASGLKRVSISGSGNSYRLEVIPELGQTMQEPVVSADGRNLILRFPGLVAVPTLQTGRLDLTTPGAVPQARYAPPLRPRAVAPPLGDMAVGTMVLQNRSFVNVSGPPVTLTLNNAPAKDAILSLAKLAGYGFVYIKDSDDDQSAEGDSRLVSMAFSDETYPRAMNSLLLASGLQAKLDGRTLMVGPSVSGKTFGPQISKVFRLNQASVGSAADYLASLGAQISKVNVISITTGESVGSGGTELNNELTQEKSSLTEVETYGASAGPLKGLTGTTDSRLQTITLVGDSRLVAVAESYLKQIDLRQRQVAVKVQILNIDLDNIKGIESSFSAKLGNTFIVSENGRAFMNFGDYRPGNRDGTGLLADGTKYVEPGSYQAGIPAVQDQLVNPAFIPEKEESRETDGKKTFTEKLVNGVPVYVEDPNPASPDVLLGKVDSLGRPVYVPGKDPTRFAYPEDSVYGYLTAVIESSSTKVLAQPTLLVQEGQEAQVQTGTSIITGVTTTDTANGSTQFEYTRENAGLTLKVNVSKIDDNGFISLKIDPTISVPTPKVGTTGGVDIFNIQSRSLSSGAIRLRDRQTLVLTGVITDQDQERASKWPILGDLPLIGQFFRGSGSSRRKNELVILVTPAIVDDESGGSYGYGYRPSTQEARQLMRSGRF
ncbi:type II secretion system protein GspD [Synechococcus sp. MIT S9503]|uniref:type II secretion system protein GspD n=1 Tax=Synechococcus sp. MIT S9503 TaxID=3082547 RepID=UPI0039A62611